jgi:hypothetical protein
MAGRGGDKALAWFNVINFSSPLNCCYEHRNWRDSSRRYEGSLHPTPSSPTRDRRSQVMVAVVVDHRLTRRRCGRGHRRQGWRGARKGRWNRPMHRSFDEIDEAAEAAADAEGLAQLDAGEGVPHAEVAAWLETWGTPGEKPAPRSWFK